MKIIDLTNQKEDFTIKLPMGAFGESQDIYDDGMTNNTISVKVPKQDPMDLVPKSWEQFCEKNSQIAAMRWCGLPKGETDAFVALGQLRMLWHEWTKALGLIDYSKGCFVIIYNYEEEIITPKATNGNVRGSLTFNELSHAQEFIKCFGELLEKAKILL